MIGIAALTALAGCGSPGPGVDNGTQTMTDGMSVDTDGTLGEIETEMGQSAPMTVYGPIDYEMATAPVAGG